MQILTSEHYNHLVIFKMAGETLAEVWSQVVIDQFPTIAEYIVPEKSEFDPESLIAKDTNWFQQHVRTSQYFTQIVKCHDMQCCSNARSSYFKVIPSRFLPPPIPVAQTTEGLKAPDKHEDSCSYKFPSMFVSQILKPDDILPIAKTVSRFSLMTSTAHLLNRVLLIGCARSATCTLHRKLC